MKQTHSNRTLWTSQDKTKRIIELLDTCSSIDDLEGDIFKPECYPDLKASMILNEREKFRRRVDEEGIFGYVLESWDSSPGEGWTHVDSCFGFIGEYKEGSENHDHYVVSELKGQAK